MQRSIDFASEFDQGLGAAAVLLRRIQIAGHFQHDRGLIGERAGAANIFLRDAGAVEPVEDAEPSEHAPGGTQQRNGQKLLHLEAG